MGTALGLTSFAPAGRIIVGVQLREFYSGVIPGNSKWETPIGMGIFDFWLVDEILLQG